MQRIALPAALGVLAVLILLGLRVGGRGNEPADFTFINRGDCSTLDIQRASWSNDLRVIRVLFEGLVAKDIFARGYDPRPRVAERWEISPDGRTYRFHIRPSARWSNGAPVTADDFVYSWRRALLPDIGCDYASQFQLIRGAKDFYDWRTRELKRLAQDADAGAGPGTAELTAQDSAPGLRLWAETVERFKSVGVRSLENGRVLEVELERPTPFWLDLCAFAVFYPVYPPQVSAMERVDERTGRLQTTSGWTKGGVLVSNGPFVLTRWRFKRDMRFEKSPTYWNRDAIAIDSMNMPSVSDPNGEVLAFTTGEVDWVSDVIPGYRREMLADKRAFFEECRARRRDWEKLVRDSGGATPAGPEPVDLDALLASGTDPVLIDSLLPDDPRKNFHAHPAFGTYFLNFNCREKLADGRDNPFRDKRVRRAFAMCVDKERVCTQVRGIGEPVSSTLVPPDVVVGYESPKGLGRDVAGARALLAEAGYPDGRGFPTVEFLVNQDGGHDIIAQAVAKDWQEQLGINVAIIVRELKVFRNDLKSQNYMVSRGSWFGDYGDPTTFLDLNRADDGNNDRKYASAEYDGILNEAREQTDPAKRLTLLTKAERLIVEEDVPLIPIFTYVELCLFDPDVITGISSHRRQEQNLYLVDRLGDGKGSDRKKVVGGGESGGQPGDR